MDPHYGIYILLITVLLESIQRKFIRFAEFLLKIHYNEHDYTFVTNQQSLIK